MTSLNATPRTETGKAGKRAEVSGSMPAVVYGPKHASESITLSLHEFEAVLRHGGETSVIDLKGLDKPLQVLIHDIDRDPVTTVPRHADLYVVEKGAKVQVALPLTFVGESLAVKEGANLVKVMHELEIEAAPADLPHDIEVDISVLASQGDQLHVSDLVLPKGVIAMVDGEEVVALIQAIEVEEESTEAVDMDAIEVEKKGKDEEEATGDAE